MLKAMIFDIQRNSFVDGPGVRTTVFFKGCILKCKWCHNPESQSFEKQTLFNKPCGKEMTVDEVLQIVMKDKVFYDASGGGVTFSGGECMLQIDFLAEVLKRCRENGIHTAVDTAGHIKWESFEKIMPYTDMFLYDIKLATDELHQKWTGVSNILILENLKRLSKEFNGEIIIRVPIIGEVNDDETEIRNIADVLKGINYTDIELLPYHKLGENKYKELGIEAEIFSVPSDENMKRFRELIYEKQS